MSKEKKYRIGTYLILIPAILFLFPKVYAQHESVIHLWAPESILY